MGKLTSGQIAMDPLYVEAHLQRGVGMLMRIEKATNTLTLLSFCDELSLAEVVLGRMGNNYSDEDRKRPLICGCEAFSLLMPLDALSEISTKVD